MVFPAYGPPDEECDNRISALDLIKGDQFGVEIMGLTESSKDRFAEFLDSLIYVDIARVLVTMGEIAQFKDGQKVVLPSFNTEVYGDAMVEGEEVMTLRLQEQETQTLFVNTSKNSPRKVETTLDG